MATTTANSYLEAIERTKSLAGFTFLRTETYKCNREQNTVALFEHHQTGLVFVLIPGTEDLPPFLLSQTPCTQTAWAVRARKDGSTLSVEPSNFRLPPLQQLAGDELPVESVSWEDCKTWLGLEDGDLRLPFEAEWEHACRAGSNTDYYFGKTDRRLKDYAWYSENANGRTHPVGCKLPNAFGLYDIVGNVWEWCEDPCEKEMNRLPFGKGAGAKAPARPTASSGAGAGATTRPTAARRTATGSAPASGTAAWASGLPGQSKTGASFRVGRGGGWLNDASFCCSAYRCGNGPGNRLGNLGFRAARSLFTFEV